MKTGIKKIRSFQRTITLLLTRSFKSASTESLLVLSNLLPLDIRIIELAAQRYLSTFGELFSPASFKTIQSFLPNILSIPPVSKSYQPHLNSHPPWTFSFDIISVFVQSNVGYHNWGNMAGNRDRSQAGVPKQRLRGVTLTPGLQASGNGSRLPSQLSQLRTLARKKGKVRTRYTIY